MLLFHKAKRSIPIAHVFISCIMYYVLQSSLQIQRSALFDDGTSYASSSVFIEGSIIYSKRDCMHLNVYMLYVH